MELCWSLGDTGQRRTGSVRAYSMANIASGLVDRCVCWVTRMTGASLLMRSSCLWNFYPRRWVARHASQLSLLVKIQDALIDFSDSILVTQREARDCYCLTPFLFCLSFRSFPSLQCTPIRLALAYRILRVSKIQLVLFSCVLRQGQRSPP